jgi:hypothetical protein
MRLYWLIPFIIFFIFIAIIWNIPVGKFSETLPVVITVAEPRQIGVHTTKEPQKMFNFGTTFPGTKAQKTLNLTRGKEPPAKVHITTSGDVIKNWTTLNVNDFVLDEDAQVEVTVAVPDNAEKNTYRGNITINYTTTYGFRAIGYLKQFSK